MIKVRIILFLTIVQTESCSQTSPHSSFLDVYIKHGLACIIIEERNIKLISQTLFTFKTQASNIKKKDGMEEVLFGCDIGALRISYKHWLSFLAVVHCSNTSTYNYHWHQRQWSTKLGCGHDEGMLI